MTLWKLTSVGFVESSAIVGDEMQQVAVQRTVGVTTSADSVPVVAASRRVHIAETLTTVRSGKPT